MYGIDNEKSDVRMAALTKPGMDNITWYSFLRYNGRDHDFIIKKMIHGLKRHLNNDMDNVQLIRFYNNHNEEIIKQFKDGDVLP